MKPPPLYSLVITIYNEEKQIGAVAQRILDYFSGRAELELVLVNNGSTDKTGEILGSLRDPRVKRISFAENQGFGGGILAGLRAARGAYIGFTTGGGQVLPESMLKIFEAARANPHAVCKAKRMARESVFRKFTSYGYNFLANALFFLWLTDVNGHPVVLERRAFREMDMQIKDFMINIELYLKAKRGGMRVIQVRIPYSKRLGGRSHVNLATVLQMFRELVAFRKNCYAYL